MSKEPREITFSNRSTTEKTFLGGERMPENKAVMMAQVVEDMKVLGVYKKQYSSLIGIYVDLNIQYEVALKEFEDSGYQYETETAAGGTKKSAIVATLESLRKDILAYSDRLCLNPKALGSVTPEGNNKSKLAAVLQELQ
ncbi:P27 family phage terminase small subunit [Clostridium beijerinckii]|uniref:P27 family phage terminase small subunit n=1 Tax=Clostridium beijerinckii TaxID=1520 RepID=UPI001FA6AD0B|nr:P27 family phage terminase small subunit [Clostridium beijerinckii]